RLSYSEKPVNRTPGGAVFLLSTRGATAAELIPLINWNLCTPTRRTMETMTISCPECDRQIKAPADAVGKKIRCKACEHVFVIKAPAKAPAPIKATKPAKAEKPAKSATAPKPAHPPKPTHYDEDDDRNPYGLAEADETLRCPQC